jgi:hypothetical protein
MGLELAHGEVFMKLKNDHEKISPRDVMLHGFTKD